MRLRLVFIYQCLDTFIFQFNRTPLTTSRAYIINDNVNWTEFKRMFSNIGWNGTLPDQYEQVKLMEDKLHEIISIMVKQQINPSKIRDKQKFIDELDKQCYDTHKQYIDHHLSQSRPKLPPPIPDSPQSHMIFLLSPYKCNRMEAQLSAISDGM